MKIGIIGCAGRMGRLLVAEVLGTEGCALVGGTEVAGSPFLGQDTAAVAGSAPAGLPIGDDPAPLFATADAVIDFTLPGATETHARLAAEHGTVFVIGTTGLGAAEQAAVDAAAAKVAVVQAANTSVGINLLVGLARQVAATLGEDYDIEILEIHHRHKLDAPSGTALALGRGAAEGRGVDLDAVSQRVRDGHTGARRRGDIGFAALRGGDVVGDHTVIFAADGERIELTHKASARSIYATGALRAALWAQDRPPGLYSMRDVLGLA